MPSSADKIQAAVFAGLAVAGKVLGQPFDLYRPLTGQTPLISQNKVTTLPAQFTSAKATGYNFDKSLTYEDLLFAGLFDATQTQVGDYLVGAGSTYFIAAMPPLLPTACVLCNRVVTVSRDNTERASAGGTPLPSQAGGTGRYFGVNRQTQQIGAGETPLASSVPVAILGTAGRATVGNTDLPADAPGPSRWRIHFPASVCPVGSIKDRDLVTDQEGYRYQISAAAWTSLGYRAEAIRLEG